MDKHKSYYTVYSVLIGIPFGLGMLIGWYSYLSSYPKTADGFTVVSGKCQFLGDTSIFSPTKNFPDLYLTVFCVKLNDSLYLSEIDSYNQVMKDGFKNYYTKSSTIVVWYDNYDDKKYIEQLSIDNKLILEYKGRPYGRSLFFLIPGLVFLIVCSGYLYNRMKENDWFKK